MRHNLAAVVSGLVFGVGLGVSGMTRPEKVIGFLDFFGEWDPSLVFVMVGAIAVNAAVYQLVVRRREGPLLGGRFQLPTRTSLDARLIGGAVLFGAGWGLGGYCPGPGIVSLATLGPSAAVFVGGMLVGMGVFEALDARLEARRRVVGGP